MFIDIFTFFRMKTLKFKPWFYVRASQNPSAKMLLNGVRICLKMYLSPDYYVLIYHVYTLLFFFYNTVPLSNPRYDWCKGPALFLIGFYLTTTCLYSLEHLGPKLY